ncbi:unnamed protein product [Symbiodinium sp. CCMP2592]|nr:unnamed protein product [Symbiodinium sp. CCMP2592]
MSDDGAAGCMGIFQNRASQAASQRTRGHQHPAHSPAILRKLSALLSSGDAPAGPSLEANEHRCLWRVEPPVRRAVSSVVLFLGLGQWVLCNVVQLRELAVTAAKSKKKKGKKAEDTTAPGYDLYNEAPGDASS